MRCFDRFAILLAVLMAAAAATAAAADQPLPSQPAGPRVPQRLKVEVVKVYPHDPQAFTQGLLWYGSSLFESTGIAGRSSVREVDIETGKVRRKIDVPLPYFGEGLALAGDKLFQLSWQHGTAFVYDLFTLSERNRLTYEGEGWGLTFDGKQLVMSDGSDELSFRDPQSFQETRRLKVTRAGQPQRRLNELEWVDGQIYANIWTSPMIVAIDPKDGAVTATIDASGLLSHEEAARAEVLNGIAWDPKAREFLITGKLWPKLFRVRLVPAP